MRSVLCLVLFGSVAGYSLPPRLPPQIPSEGFVREAEKKHARTALLALPTLATIYGATGHNPVTYLSEQSADVQAGFFVVAGLMETVGLSRLAPGFGLADGVEPGNWGVETVDPQLDELEDGLGRVAMLATTLTMLYWLCTPF